MRGGRLRRGRTTATLLALVICLAGTALGCGSDESDPNAEIGSAIPKLDPALAAHLPPGATMEMAERGRKLFVTCSVCHGLDAGGTQLGPSLRDGRRITIDGSPASIEAVIRQGVQEPAEFETPMPAMGGGTFDDAQLRDLVAYVFALDHSTHSPQPDDSASADSGAKR